MTLNPAISFRKTHVVYTICLINDEKALIFDSLENNQLRTS